jgi:hypothetical protein
MFVMEDPNIRAGKSLVKNSLKASAVQLGLPTPIVNWQTHFFRDTTVYTALIFVGEQQKRMSFLAQELNALADPKQPSVIKNRTYDVLAK